VNIGIDKTPDINDMLRQNGPGFVRKRVDEAWTPPGMPPPDIDPPLATAFDPWQEPDWSLLDERRPNLPAFPVSALAPEWQDWLRRSAHGAGVTPDHVVVPLLAVASGLIGTSRRIKPSGSWTEPCTLWMVLIGDSGTGKTPGLNVTKRALSSIEHSRKDRITDLQLAHETKVQAAKAADAMWKAEIEEAVLEGKEVPLKPIAAIGPGGFVVPRLYVSNVTIERLAALLQGRPSGLILIADELAGLFLNMSRYSNGQDNEFWLECWNGEKFIVERAARPAVVIEHLLVGITGGFQPDKLSRSLSGDQDGMYARMCFGWPDEPGYRKLAQDSAEIEPPFLMALTRLVDLPMLNAEVFTPRDVELTHRARNQFEQFRQFLHEGKESLQGREREWWAKGASHVLRLAGTLAFMEWSMHGGPEPVVIDEQYITAAILIWREYFVPHSFAAIRCIGHSDQHIDERQVLRWIKANNKAEISTADIRRDALSQRLNGAHTLRLLDRLTQAGWLREAPIKGTGPGRPAHRWQVNPQLLAQGDAGIAEIAEIHRHEFEGAPASDDLDSRGESSIDPGSVDSDDHAPGPGGSNWTGLAPHSEIAV
jgi:Protein of unknown function (DUF3987)